MRSLEQVVLEGMVDFLGSSLEARAEIYLNNYLDLLLEQAGDLDLQQTLEVMTLRHPSQ